jgi:hypothetical protein
MEQAVACFLLSVVAAGTPGAWFRAADHRPDAAPAAFERYLETLGRFDFGPNRGTVFSAHQMGTARFGDDPSKHACDPFGRVRTSSRAGRDAVVKGLYVADACAVPDRSRRQPDAHGDGLARRVARTVLGVRVRRLSGRRAARQSRASSRRPPRWSPRGSLGGRTRSASGPTAGRDDQRDGEHDDRAGEQRPGIDGLAQEDPGQHECHDRVHVGVGGDLRQWSDRRSQT